MSTNGGAAMSQRQSVLTEFIDCRCNSQCDCQVDGCDCMADEIVALRAERDVLRTFVSIFASWSSKYNAYNAVSMQEARGDFEALMEAYTAIAMQRTNYSRRPAPRFRPQIHRSGNSI